MHARGISMQSTLMIDRGNSRSKHSFWWSHYFLKPVVPTITGFVATGFLSLNFCEVDSV
jgi:hypothetical protein